MSKRTASISLMSSSPRRRPAARRARASARHSPAPASQNAVTQASSIIRKSSTAPRNSGSAARARRSASDAPVAPRKTGSRSSCAASQPSARGRSFRRIPAACSSGLILGKVFLTTRHHGKRMVNAQREGATAMSGTVLIVDGLATNRIVLKAKLATTPYRIIQAASARDALRLADAGDARPDPCQHLPRRPERRAVPARPAPDRATGAGACRHAAGRGLRAGTQGDAARRGGRCSRPAALRAVLLARLRNLMRKHHSEAELVAQTGDAGGFAEAQAVFEVPGRVGIFAPSRAEALALRGLLEPVCPHRLTCVAAREPAARRRSGRAGAAHRHGAGRGRAASSRRSQGHPRHEPLPGARPARPGRRAARRDAARHGGR